MALSVSPADPDDVYQITKLAGEAVCLSLPQPTVRVARLSNVIGAGSTSNNFLPVLIAEAKSNGAVAFLQAPELEKDFIALDDVLMILEAIALRGQKRLYNVASGRNVTHRIIAELIRDQIGAAVKFAADAPRIAFPPIAIQRIRSEFGPRITPFEIRFDSNAAGPLAIVHSMRHRL